jgi:hypothetical protein
MQDDQIAGINISDYAAMKEKGLITVAKIGDAFAIAVKVFSVSTGEELKPMVYGIALEEVEEQRVNLLQAVDDMQALLTDLEVLNDKQLNKLT